MRLFSDKAFLRLKARLKATIFMDVLDQRLVIKMVYVFAILMLSWLTDFRNRKHQQLTYMYMVIRTCSSLVVLEVKFASPN